MRIRYGTATLAGLFLLLGLFAPPRAHAQSCDLSWANPVDGNWNIASN